MMFSEFKFSLKDGTTPVPDPEPSGSVDPTPNPEPSGSIDPTPVRYITETIHIDIYSNGTTDIQKQNKTN
jgi:hypothetical protein